MQLTSPTDFDRLSERLSLISDLVPSVPEAHGMLCGLLCAGAPEAERTWVDELCGGTDPRDLAIVELRDSLGRLAQAAREELDGPGLGITPLLPPDDRSLRERAVGLYDWSRGFLYGAGLAGIDAARLSAEAREALDDLAGITHLDLDSLDEGEDNEEALAELTEFVWVAAMLIHAEQSPADPEPS